MPCTYGVIEAVARVKCGGSAGLQESLEKGHCWIDYNVDGVPLYYFPESSKMRIKTGSTIHKFKQSKNAPADVMKHFSDTVQQLGWDIKPKV